MKSGFSSFCMQALQIRGTKYHEQIKNTWLKTSFTLNTKAHITLDEFEWQSDEFIWENDEFDFSIPTSLSGRDEFQWLLWQLTNLNA